MSVSSILSSGLQGLQSAIQRTGVASGRIAATGAADNTELAANLVAMRQGEIDVKAAAQVVRTGDEILGTIIDIRG